jgi:hypothetical protein
VAADRAQAGDVRAPVDLAAAGAHDAALAEQLESLGGATLDLLNGDHEPMSFRTAWTTSPAAATAS